MYPISEIPGLETSHWQTFALRRIRTTRALLDALKGQRQRDQFAIATSIAAPDLLRFANAADLMRIQGIGQHSVELLRAVGVSTVRELRCRNAEKLHKALIEANQRLAIMKFSPAKNFVARWIAQAKRLELVITY